MSGGEQEGRTSLALAAVRPASREARLAQEIEVMAMQTARARGATVEQIAAAAERTPEEVAEMLGEAGARNEAP